MRGRVVGHVGQAAGHLADEVGVRAGLGELDGREDHGAVGSVGGRCHDVALAVDELEGELAGHEVATVEDLGGAQGDAGRLVRLVGVGEGHAASRGAEVPRANELVARALGHLGGDGVRGLVIGHAVVLDARGLRVVVLRQDLGDGEGVLTGLVEDEAVTREGHVAGGIVGARERLGAHVVGVVTGGSDGEAELAGDHVVAREGLVDVEIGLGGVGLVRGGRGRDVGLVVLVGDDRVVALDRRVKLAVAGIRHVNRDGLGRVVVGPALRRGRGGLGHREHVVARLGKREITKVDGIGALGAS